MLKFDKTFKFILIYLYLGKKFYNIENEGFLNRKIIGVVLNLTYFKKILIDTIESINKLYENKIYEITVRRIRNCKKISSTEKSKIAFISKILNELSIKGLISYVGKNSPKKYKINNKIEIAEALKIFKFE